MTAKITADATGTKVTIGTAAEDALQIDATAKTIKALAPYQMGGNAGPAFKCVADSNQPLTSGTGAKVTGFIEVFDTNSNFANDRFTPNVAGYYLFTASITGNGASFTTLSGNFVGQSGGGAATSSFGTLNVSGVSGANLICGASLFYMNGTTDYMEVQAYMVGTSPFVDSAEFSGALVRAA